MLSVSLVVLAFMFFFKQKTAYERRISDWSSDVCSSDRQRAFGPCAQRSGAGGSNQHQRVDLELLHPKVVDRLAQREEPAEEIGCDIAGRGQPLRCAGNQPFDRIA